MSNALSPEEIESAREDTPGVAHVVHLNHAGSSLPPQPVLDRQIGHLHREGEIGGYEAAAEAIEADHGVYDSIAGLINAKPHEIARVEHATAAWNAGFWSVQMRPGQRIITAEAAYGANAVGFLRAAQRRGVEIDVVPSDSTGQVDLKELERRLDADCALVAITHIPTNGGLINPAAEVGRLARSAGVPFLLDACQSIGQLDIDVDAIGCDLLSATGRKYLRGPRGSGFLYASDRIIDDLITDHPDHHGAKWNRGDGFDLWPGAKRFEYWEYNHASWLALGTAVDYARVIGTDRIEPTVIQRAAQLRDRLHDAQLPVYDIGQRQGALVTTNVPGRDPGEVKAALGAQHINTSVTNPDGTLWDFERRGLAPMLRVSVHYTTTEDELDQAVTALRSL
ncbi:MAG: aminotransferase class V-fold PLP-dependent enzyme [Acidimicrobiales bacterium]|nr:MAG: aminotransferase class V-fold PLP-dependent enzyme [Acidimicrobiales bacterium]